jgi:hypothetical protein
VDYIEDDSLIIIGDGSTNKDSPSFQPSFEIPLVNDGIPARQREDKHVIFHVSMKFVVSLLEPRLEEVYLFTYAEEAFSK